MSWYPFIYDRGASPRQTALHAALAGGPVAPLRLRGSLALLVRFNPGRTARPFEAFKSPVLLLTPVVVKAQL